MLDKGKRRYKGEGRQPPEDGFKRLYNTPIGPFPKLVDVAEMYGMFKSNVSRRYTSQTDPNTPWYIIENPSEDQCDQAIDNVNEMFMAKYEAEDHCGLCNAVDDMIFKEGCWLLKVIHEHGTTNIDNVIISYTYRRKDYRVTYLGWIAGERPHVRL